MYDMALADKSVIGLKTYLEAYPDGIYARRAQNQIAALEPAAAAPAPVPKLVEPEPMPAPTPSAEKSAVPDENLLITLNTPLTTGDERVRGATIAELIKGTPSFPPIEGLPDELWKGQTCSNCHQWTPEALCEQANTYVNAESLRAVKKQHPYGGVLKVNLRQWATGGCQ